MPRKAQEFTLARLKTSTREELEAIYLNTEPAGLPEGLFRGHFLCMLDSRDAKHIGLHLMSKAGFKWTPFWVDLSKQHWHFWYPLFGMGRFDTTLGPSRWRKTRTYRLDYSASSLPGVVSRQLYDEVKPLNTNLCLGVGGINAGEKNRGDLFFFALAKVG